MSKRLRRGIATRLAPLPADLQLALLAVPMLEALEDRRLFDGSSLAGDVLTMTGHTNAPNTFDVRIVSNKIRATVNGKVGTFVVRPNLSIVVQGGELGDRLTSAGGAIPMAVFGRGGDDTLQSGAAADTIDGGEGFDTADGGAGVDAGNALEVTASVESGAVGPISRTGTRVDVAATEATNQITVTLDAAAQTILFRCNANAATYHLADVQSFTIAGGTGNDTIAVSEALALPSTIAGGAGDDSIRAGGGADSIDGGDGFDTADGGAGVDAGSALEVTTSVESGTVGPISRTGARVDVVATEATNQITVTPDGAAQTVTFRSNAYAATYRLADVESFTIAGGTGNDTITVAEAIALPSTIGGGAGDDLIRAGGGADSIDGGNGFDTADGGAGIDAGTGLEVTTNVESGTVGPISRTGTRVDVVATEATNEITVTVDAAAQTVLFRSNAYAATYSLADVQSFTLAGGTGNDTITVAEAIALPSTIAGGAGDDSIRAGGGTDSINGGAGFDTADGGAGVDAGSALEVTTSVESGAVGPIGRTGTRVDVVATEATSEITVTLDAAAQAVTFRSGTYAATYALADVLSYGIVGGIGNDTITVADALTLPSTIRGGAGDDTIRAGGGADSVLGDAGNDLIYGGPGNDTLRGGEGDDRLDGGLGTDRVDGGLNTDLAVVGDRFFEVDFTALSLEPGIEMTPQPDTPMDGTILGTAGSSQNLGNTIDRVFDGDLATFFDGPTSNNGWAGLDLGVGRAVGEIRYAPRAGWTSRMLGGAFQGSHTPNFAFPTTLAMVRTVPPAGVFTSVIAADVGAFRYVRYLAPAGASGNVAEVQFFTRLAATTPTDPVPTGPPPTGADSVPLLGEAADPVARILATTGTSVIAGQAVHLHGLGSALNGGNPTTARYEWDFGDPAAPYNRLVGFNAAHVYDQPGTFTATLRVINESGRSATTSVVVTVAEDARPTIHVAADGDDARDGATAETPVRTYARAAALLGRRDGVSVLFRRGDTFDVTSELVVTGDRVTVGAYGVGERPVLRYVGARSGSPAMIGVRVDAADTVVRDLTLDSAFTADTEQSGMPVGLMIAGTNTAVRGNQFRNLGYAMNVTPASAGTLALGNTAPLATGIRGYFMWLEGRDVVALGNVVANSTREHNIRASGVTRVLIHDNTLTNLDRRGIDGVDSAKDTVNIQKGSHVYVSGNKLDGPTGIGPLGIASMVGEKWTRTANVVFERNRQISGQVTLWHGAEHVMIRSNIFDADDATHISVQGYDSTFQRGVVNLSIVNNTGLNEGTAGHFLYTAGPVDGIRLLNNLYVAPNLWTGSYNTSPVQVWANDLSSFGEISGNNWGDPNKHGWAQGGVNWVGTANDSSSYQTASEWNELAGVGTDLFVDVEVDYYGRAVSNGEFIYGGIATAGVFVDFYGNYRDVTKWTVGAA